MTKENDQDLASLALMTAAKELETSLSEDFIRASYAIQRRHQFNQDQTISLQDLERLVEDFLGDREPQ